MVMIFKDNKFWINNRYQNTINWTCRDRKRLGCNSCVQTTSEGRYLKHKEISIRKPQRYRLPNENDEGDMILVANGKKLFMLNNYTYCKRETLKKGAERWQCSRRTSQKCFANVVLGEDKKILKIFGKHTHFPPHIEKVLMVKGRHGKDLLMLNGYTYYQHKLLKDGFRWSCTQMGSRSCRGFLHVTGEMLVVRAQTEHTHPPSTYFLEKFKSRVKGGKKEDDSHPGRKNPDGRQGINPLALKIANIQGRVGF